ncbi:hypothetical protein AVEN_195116-1 [Araneus ventricosus]|uniref:Uncharacterized protein n=1 Tax=Araneus ventricosus TaxID=182803 RepID=A0A4Y2BJ87_ARAVE|nr:hypothetical protein AVEN_195116-1 [Araneus ventricosus]
MEQATWRNCGGGPYPRGGPRHRDCQPRLRSGVFIKVHYRATLCASVNNHIILTIVPLPVEAGFINNDPHVMKKNALYQRDIHYPVCYACDVISLEISKGNLPATA